LDIDPRTAVTVMLVSGGYPGSYPKGLEITMGDLGDTIAFHAGTARSAEGKLLTAGGRVIALSSYADANLTGADAIQSALNRSYAAAEKVNFNGKYCRRDIGRDLMAL
jgi:phosphoribosylamine--glycine ligase